MKRAFKRLLCWVFDHYWAYNYGETTRECQRCWKVQDANGATPRGTAWRTRAE